MKVVKYSILPTEQKWRLLRMWNNEYPLSLKYECVADLDRYLQGLLLVVHYLLIDEKGVIMGWAWVFDRDGERWFAIVLDNSLQRMGYGSMLLDTLKENEAVLCGWVEDNNDKVKSNGEPYLSPIAFYKKNGFLLHPNDRLKTDKVSAVKIKWERS